MTSSELLTRTTKPRYEKIDRGRKNMWSKVEGNSGCFQTIISLRRRRSASCRENGSKKYNLSFFAIIASHCFHSLISRQSHEKPCKSATRSSHIRFIFLAYFFHVSIFLLLLDLATHFSAPQFWICCSRRFIFKWRIVSSMNVIN